MNLSIFRAYDIRGKYPSEIKEETVFEISRALGHFWKGGKIVVARDGRLSSLPLYRAVLRGLKIQNKELKIVKAGLATTPMFYFLVIKLKARGGIMITASHNPKEYNGLKVVGKNAEMISGKEVLKIISKS
jgi:phosphomannomutase